MCLEKEGVVYIEGVALSRDGYFLSIKMGSIFVTSTIKYIIRPHLSIETH